MCAISGIISFKKILSEYNLNTEAVLSSMHHRGPDDRGFWAANEYVQLFHTRLAIIDLDSRSKQPFISSSKRSALTYNGEIYNFQELKKKVNTTWKTESDTEVLVELLESESTAAIDQLDGMFSFGFFDVSSKTLTLAVDPAGKKPLYTYWDGETFAFASEIKTLRAMGLPLVKDELSSVEFLFYGYTPAPHTVYKNIRKLPAGHFQKVSVSGPQPIQKYFKLQQTTNHQSYDDSKQQLLHLISAAVKKRLISDRPVGSFLSGGLDSSIVSLEASKLLNSPLKTFSISFTKKNLAKDFDESEYAKIVSEKIGSEHSVYNLDGYYPKYSEIIQHFDEPFADSSSLPTAFLCQNVSQKIKVALSGDGGDELFGGYERFKACLIAQQFKHATPLFELMAFLIPKKINFSKKMSRFSDAMNEKSLHRLALWNSYYSFEDIKKISKQAEEHLRFHLQSWDDQLNGLSLGEKILHFNFHHYLQNDLLPKVDRMSMMYGLEVRSPLLDKQLIQFAFSLPTKHKFNMHQSKIILKDAYRAELGSVIVDRKKKGFGFPLDDFFKQNHIAASTHTTASHLATNSSKKYALLCLDLNKGHT